MKRRNMTESPSRSMTKDLTPHSPSWGFVVFLTVDALIRLTGWSVQSQLQPDPNEEIAAPLHILIHKIDNACAVLTVSRTQSSQPQGIRYTSLAAPPSSALATPGKQRSNQYAFVNGYRARPNRQRELDGIVTWYFDHVMEPLRLTVILQFALSLFFPSASGVFTSVRVDFRGIGIRCHRGEPIKAGLHSRTVGSRVSVSRTVQGNS